ncbi:MAG: DUF4270 domain-containing protein [Flavobacterium sp.]|nr:DUF4270 domain-containing protein [Flavobacterium sp.]
MHNNSIFKQILLVVSIVLFVSCDKDYNAIGDGLIGDNHFELTKDNLSTVQSAWKKTGPIASNNLDINALGVLDNSAFGQTTANFVTQVQLASVSPVIDAALGQVVESVTLYIPYFTKSTITTGADGRPIYTLDSIYGNKTSKIKLNIYENKYLLGNKNTEVGAPLLDTSYPQLYYTNQSTVFNDKKGELLYENSAFAFSEKEFADPVAATTTTAATTTYVAPGMRLELNKTFFQNLLFNSNSSYNLSSNAIFEDYFKGLYFNVEKVDAVGVLTMMNFKKGTIVVKYKEKTSSTVATLVDKSITLNLTGNTVNLLNNEPSTAPDSYSSPKTDRLYVKGGEGSVATIDLFNPTVDVVTYNKTTKKIVSGSNTIPDELDYIKEKGWLINEASLTFYVDQALMAGVTEPTSLFLYDINNQQVLSGGVIEKGSDGRGLKYRVRITDYVRGLVKNDNVNVKLGISIAQTTSNVKFKKIQNAPLYAQWLQLATVDKNAYFFPESSVMSPLGTILYGSATAVPEDKRLKLEIYYTKPN